MATGSDEQQPEPMGPTVRPDAVATPHPSRLEPSRADREALLAAHAVAVASGQPGYIDPFTGLFVMTAVHLLNRGWCCDRGCRHCPYVGASPAGRDTPPNQPSTT